MQENQVSTRLQDFLFKIQQLHLSRAHGCAAKCETILAELPQSFSQCLRTFAVVAMIPTADSSRVCTSNSLLVYLSVCRLHCLPPEPTLALLTTLLAPLPTSPPASSIHLKLEKPCLGCSLPPSTFGEPRLKFCT